MFEEYANIVLFGLAAAFGAATIALLLIFLQQRGYLKLAIAVLLGMIVMQYLQGALIRGMPRLQALANSAGSGVPARPGLMALLGALMLYGAWRQWRGGGGDALNERLNKLLPRLGFFTAFAIGLLLILTNIKIWALALATIETTREQTSSYTVAAVNYTLFVLVAQCMLLAFVLAQVIAPSKSKKPLDSLSAWLQRNGSYVIAIVTAVLGLYFFFNGVYYLLQ